MGSPSMDRYAGYSQARLDLMRGDTFALLNHQHPTLDWNQDQAAWIQGYRAALSDAVTSTDPVVADLARDTLTALSDSDAHAPCADTAC